MAVCSPQPRDLSWTKRVGEVFASAEHATLRQKPDGPVAWPPPRLPAIVVEGRGRRSAAPVCSSRIRPNTDGTSLFLLVQLFLPLREEADAVLDGVDGEPDQG